MDSAYSSILPQKFSRGVLSDIQSKVIDSNPEFTVHPPAIQHLESISHLNVCVFLFFLLLKGHLSCFFVEPTGLLIGNKISN